MWRHSTPTSALALKASKARPIYTSDGYLLYTRGRTLFAQRFDTDRLEVIGEPTLIADGLGRHAYAFGETAFSVSKTGTLVYWTGAALNGELLWFDPCRPSPWRDWRP